MPALDGNSRPHEEARLGHFLEPCCYGQVREKFAAKDGRRSRSRSRSRINSCSYSYSYSYACSYSYSSSQAGKKYSGLGEGIPDRCSEGRVSSRA